MQIRAERTLHAEIGGRIAQLAHDAAEGVDAFALKVGGNQAAVPDRREGEQHELPVVGRVGQGLVAADHRGGEDQLADCIALAADALALENLPVLKQDVCVFHRW